MTKRIVFVIGAGASKEVNMPVGEELKENISRLLDIRYEGGFRLESGDFNISEALKIHTKNIGRDNSAYNNYLKESRRISKALTLAISIDNYIDSQRGNEEIELCSKLAIVKAILESEGKSLLANYNSRGNGLDFKKLKNTWYLPFFKLLTENCTKEDLKDRFKNVTLVIFNYDRCVEQFLYYALQQYYDVNVLETYEILEQLEIYHPYGDVGLLLNRAGENLGYGGNPAPDKLLELSKRIKTFTEGVDPESSDIKEIREKTGLANKLVFLGFAYHKINMELIKPYITTSGGINPECYGTTYNISLQDQSVIKNELSEYFDIHDSYVSLSLPTVTCKDFFNEFWRSLAFDV